MNEHAAFDHTVKTLLDTWANPQLRGSFLQSSEPLLDWFLTYALLPLEAIVGLVEHLAFMPAHLYAADKDALCHAVLRVFQQWLSSRPEVIERNIQTTPSLQVRMIRLFGKYFPQLLIKVQNVFPQSDHSRELCELIAETVSFLLPADTGTRLDDALAVLTACPAIRLVDCTKLSQLIVFALCTRRRVSADRLFHSCPLPAAQSVLTCIDYLLAVSEDTFTNEVFKFLRFRFPSDDISKVSFHKFLSDALIRSAIESSVCPNFLFSLKTKLFKYFVRKALSSSRPEMDICSFFDAVQDLGEGDDAFQGMVDVSLKALGHLDLAKAFSDYFRGTFDSLAAKRARHSSSSQIVLPERFANVKPFIQRGGNVYAPSLMPDDILFVDNAYIFGTAIEVMKHVDLLAVRVYWQRRFKLIYSDRRPTISLLVIAIPQSVFVFDLLSLSRLKDAHVGKAFADLEILLRSDRVCKLVFLPSSEERALIRGRVFSESMKCFNNRLSICALSSNVDPSRKLTQLSGAVRRWLQRDLPCFYRLNNWMRRPLPIEQVRFAATECYALLDIYFEMVDCCSKFNLEFEAMKNMTMESTKGNFSDSEGDDDDQGDNEDETDDGEDDYRRNFRFPKAVPSREKVASQRQPLLPPPLLDNFPSNEPPTRYYHKTPDSASSSSLSPSPWSKHALLPVPFEQRPSKSMPVLTRQDRNAPVSLEKKLSFGEPLTTSANISLGESTTDRSSAAEKLRKSTFFVVTYEFINVAIELSRLGFFVQLRAPSLLQPERVLRLLNTRPAFKRFIISTREVVDIIHRYSDGSESNLVNVAALSPSDDFNPNPRQVVVPILRMAELSLEEIERHYELQRFPLEGAPLLIYHPRGCMAVKMLRELRDEGKYNFCSSPDIQRMFNEQELARLAGHGLPYNGNRILLTTSRCCEILAQYTELRLVKVPPFEQFYRPGPGDHLAPTDGKPKPGMAQQTAWIVAQLNAMLPPHLLPLAAKRHQVQLAPEIAPTRAITSQAAVAGNLQPNPVKLSMNSAPIPNHSALLPVNQKPSPPKPVEDKVEENLPTIDVSQLEPVKPHPNPQKLSDVALLFFTLNKQLLTLASQLSALGFSTSTLPTSGNSSVAALTAARQQRRVLIVDDQLTLDQIASVGAQPGEAIILTAPDGRLFTQMRLLAEKFGVKEQFTSLLSGNLGPKQMEPPIRLMFFGDSLKCVSEFLSKIPAFFDVISSEEATAIAKMTPVINLREAKMGMKIAIDIAAQSAIRLERVLVADCLHCPYFTKNRNVPFVLLAPDRTLELAKIIFDLFQLPVPLLLPPFRPASVDKLRYVIHSKPLGDFGNYLKLAGLEARIDTVHKPFTEACALARRENRFIISMSTRDTTNYLWSNPNIVSNRSVLLITDDLSKPMPLIDLTKRIFEQVASKLASSDR